MEFKTTLKTLMKENNITYDKLKEDIGYGRSTIGAWLKGDKKPNSTAIITLARYFNVSTDYLLGLENEDGTKIIDSEQEQYLPIVARSKDNAQRNLTISKSELKKLIAEAIEYTNKNKGN